MTTSARERGGYPPGGRADVVIGPYEYRVNHGRGEVSVTANVTVLFQMGYKLDTGNIFAKMTVAQMPLGIIPCSVRRIEHEKRQDNVCRELFR